MELVGNSWDKTLEHEYRQEYFKKIVDFINKEYNEKIIYPPKSRILRALSLTKYEDVKVVILGQDPYHGEGEANGLAFAVSNGIKLPPSLRNIYKELKSDLGLESPNVGSLECWAKEGVLLLNAVLTVIKDSPASMRNMGWETFTDNVIKVINEKEEPVVFILWGNFARSKKKFITNPKHLILESAHPSPLSAYNGFFGSKPFSKTNDFLIKNNIKPINWEIKQKNMQV